ncbi:heterokaryon incompatibility protein-domain-containing protein [Aspergillus bertholletiae]|uniref:Heterokaryon incompatibility protein-domain-containing protein n=1 Tax=Aspergillus bertholletiae TaxID=1226010 RepID=A0A5N7BJ62_9EURO|nr:heterokaryon incompatibility protein-domain-containing protein [Aspergillus bertholletiae]
MSTNSQHPLYAPLPAGKWTRLLILDPGPWDQDAISATLVTAQIGHDSYEAISYVWGGPAKMKKINCQGYPLNVTASLYQALRQVRRTSEPRRIWADAICINQSDLQEKSLQVNMMGAIYSQAEQVIVSFGDDGMNGEAARVAFQVIEDYNRLAAKYLSEERIRTGEWWQPDGGYGTITFERLQHVVPIFEKPWFQRVWVIQEIGLAKNALLAYGTSVIDFVQIMEFVQAWARTGRHFPGISFKSGHISNVFNNVWVSYTDVHNSWFRDSYILTTISRHTERSNREFEDVLFRARHIQRATDSRDYIYAFLGHPLAKSKTGRLLLEADYTIDLPELRCRLFSRLGDNSLRFLGLVWNRSPQDLKSQCPSWCPHVDTRRPWTINGRYAADRCNFRPAQSLTTNQIDGSRLELRVFLIDTVHSCGEVADIPTGAGMKDAWDTEPDYRNVETLLSESPSLAERYWSLLQEFEKQSSLSYPDKPLALASTLLGICDSDDDLSIARSFIEFCGNHCRSILAHLRDSGWLKQYSSGSKTRYIPFLQRAANHIKGERFFITMNGYIGTGSPLVEPGDRVCIIPTVQTPLIIRRIPDRSGVFYAIGSCYVHGMMYGEVLERLQQTTGVREMTTVVLI